MMHVQKTLVGLGLGLLAVGLLWPWLGKIPFGRLPGDIVIDRPGVKVFLPITTMAVVSLVLSLLLRLFRK
ncbi:MAG: hypothetical protein A2521_01045 [Deltaproteobacteria bacterium RIFOXYD12_FULL_57_12]|nr:MAG: hypothetical protein A2521_01045 [Deltaproteobacteria bacterium RIFOXYD12_FULL_57_12]